MDSEFKARFDELVEEHKQGLVVGLGKDEEDTFNLLILALRQLKHKGDEDIMGYFQIAAIHGYPLTPWNNIKGKKRVPDVDKDPNNDGYCPHGKNTFPTWHRPYLAMLEQALFIEMVRIAESYKDEEVRLTYIEAAKKFRLPYWDYWRPRGGPVTFPGVVDAKEGDDSTNYQTTYFLDYSAPRIFTDETIMVRMNPSNKLKPIKNPFWHFIFSKYSGSLQDNEWKYMDDYRGPGGNMINRSQTSRHPFPTPKQSTVQDVLWDNPIRMNSVLNEMRMDATRIALKMLSKSNAYRRYELFSCTTQDSKPDPTQEKTPQAKAKADVGTQDEDKKGQKHEGFRQHMSTSLEGIHNMYHIMIGGLQPGGHMSRVPTSAFDPIFWFHHNQIERIFAIWQSIHAGEKEAWFDDDQVANGPLTPFLKSTGTPDFYDIWSPNGVKSTETFGYTYEDIRSTPDETIDGLWQRYGWSVAMNDTKTRPNVPKGYEPLDLSNSMFFKLPRKQVPALLSENLTTEVPSQALEARISSLSVADEQPLSSDTTIWDWEICDQVQRQALNGSFAILYFILQQNEVKAEYESPELAPTLAGMTSIFASPSEGCANCRKHGENASIMRNAVPITSQLMDYVVAEPLNLPSLEPKHVVPFLQKRLRWQIINVNGSSKDPRDMSNMFDFKLEVVSYKSTVGERMRGEYPDPQPYPEIFNEIVGNASDAVMGTYAEI